MNYQNIEDASKLSTKVIKQNVNDIDTIVHKIENRLVPKGGSNQPIFKRFTFLTYCERTDFLNSEL